MGNAVSSPAALSSQGMSRACEAVFNTAELLEEILLQLPIEDLLLSERVCKRWRDTAAHSTSIKRALYYEAVIDMQDDIQAHECKAATINPLLQSFIICDVLEDRKTDILDICYSTISLVIDTELFAHESWHMMLITQPPAIIAKIRCSEELRSHCQCHIHAAHELEVSNAKGITMGDVVKAMKDHKRNYHRLLESSISTEQRNFGVIISGTFDDFVGGNDGHAAVEVLGAPIIIRKSPWHI